MSALDTLYFSAKNPGKYLGILTMASLLQLLMTQEADGQVYISPNTQMYIKNGASIQVP